MVAPAQPRLNGRRTRDEVEAAPASPPAPLGRAKTVIADLREGFHRVDLRLYGDDLVLERVPGADPVLVGRVAGALLLGPVGLVLGNALGRRVARKQRGARLTAADQECGERISSDQLVAVTVQRLPWGGNVRIAAGGSVARTLRWSRRDHSVNDVAGHMQTVASHRFSLLPYSNRLAILYKASVALLAIAVVAMVAIPVKMVAFPAARPGDDLPAAARDALGRACPVWRQAPLGGPELGATASRLKPDFEVAAAALPEFASLGADVATVEAFAPKARTAGIPLTEAAAFSAAIDHIDAACARVGL